MANGRAGAGSRLSDTDFGDSPYAELPRRKHARREIAPESGGLGTDLPPARRRRLSSAERKALQDRRQQRATPLPQPNRVRARVHATGGKPTAVHRGLALGGVVVVTLTLLAFAAGRLLNSGTGSPPPTATAPAVMAFGARPTPARVVVASPARATPAATPVALTFNNLDGKKVVCIDPGHGGPDTGYVRQDDGVAPAAQEKDLNLQYAMDLASRLREDGIRVVMTRQSDHAVNLSNADMNHNGKTGQYGTEEWDFDELQARIDVCNRANADLMISVHINGFPDEQARGYEVWYTGVRPFHQQSQFLADQVDQDLTTNMTAAGYDGPNRGAQDDINANVQNSRDRFTAAHYVIIGPAIKGEIDPPSLMPGVICEPLFISNDADANFAISQAGQNAIVSSYEQAILAYFKKYPY